MIKNILLILVGIIVGGAVVGGSMYFLYTKNILPAAVDNLGIPETNPFTAEEQKRALDVKPIRLSISNTIVSQKYNDLMQKIINSNNNIVKNNNEIIYPVMAELRNRSKNADWQGIFEIILKAKEAITANQKIIGIMKETIYSLQTENNATTKNTVLSQKTQLFAQSALNSASAYESYFSTLSQFVTGKVPTKELGDELNQKISTLAPAQRDFQSKTSDVFGTIESLTPKTETSSGASTTDN